MQVCVQGLSKMLKIRQIFSLFLLSVFFVSPFLVPSVRCESVPSWFKEGVFVEIRFARFPGIGYVGGRSGGPPSRDSWGFLRWEVLDFDGEIARMSIALYRSLVGGSNRNLVFQAEFYVNVTTRYVTSLDGASLGITTFWVPAHLKIDDVIPYVVQGSNITMGKVWYIGTKRTCQGYQSDFIIDTINRHVDHMIIGPYGTGSFDEDTGIKHDGLFAHDGALAAMSIEELIPGSAYLSDTNIDLGPRVLTLEILSFFIQDYPFSIPLIVLVIVFLLVYRRRRKKRRLLERQ